MRPVLKCLVTLGIVLAVIGSAWPECPLKVERVQKLVADDRAALDSFGASVSVDGDTVVIGASDDDDNGSLSGSAYVFTRSNGMWTQQAKLLPDDGGAGDRFGTSAALKNDIVLVGAPRDDDNGLDSGSCYVFTRSNGMWTQQAKLLPDDGGAGDRFGTSISLDQGSTAVVGAELDDDNGSLSGSAYVFTRSNGTWTQQAKLLPDDGGTGDRFGKSVSVSDDTAAIGAWFDDDNGIIAGSAYVFTRSNGTWTQQAKLLPDDGEPLDFFGLSVSVDGDTVVIGSELDDIDPGSAYVFTRSNGMWTQQAKLLPDPAVAGSGFGSAVSLKGDSALIGAMNRGGNGGFAGSAYVFTRSNDVWKQQAKLVGDSDGDFFGFSATFDGRTAIIGAPTDFVPVRSGSAYVFRLLFDPIDLLDALADDVRSLDLHHGTEASLLAKLDSALLILTGLNDANDHAAANVLGAFINQVEAQSGKKVDQDDADGLIQEAECIIELLQEAQ